MSIAAYEQARLLDLPPCEKAVLKDMALVVDQGFTYFRSQEETAQGTGYDVRQVRRAQLKLEKRGLIERQGKLGRITRWFLKLATAAGLRGMAPGPAPDPAPAIPVTVSAPTPAVPDPAPASSPAIPDTVSGFEGEIPDMVSGTQAAIPDIRAMDSGHPRQKFRTLCPTDSKRIKTNLTKPAAPADSPTSEGLRQVMRTYPRIGNLGEARRAWPEAVAAAGSEAVLVAAVIAQRDYLQARADDPAGNLCPSLAAWLSRGHWAKRPRATTQPAAQPHQVPSQAVQRPSRAPQPTQPLDPVARALKWFQDGLKRGHHGPAGMLSLVQKLADLTMAQAKQVETAVKAQYPDVQW